MLNSKKLFCMIDSNNRDYITFVKYVNLIWFGFGFVPLDLKYGFFFGGFVFAR